MDSVPLPPRMRQARTVTLIEVVVAEGQGVSGDMVRQVTYYFTPSGDLVAKRDPIEERPLDPSAAAPASLTGAVD